MNLDTTLIWIEDARTQLSLWGIHSGALIAIAVGGSLMFLLSMREVLGWYLRTQEIRNELGTLRQQIAALHQRLDILEPETAAAEPAAEQVKLSVPSSTKFRLDH